MLETSRIWALPRRFGVALSELFARDRSKWSGRVSQVIGTVQHETDRLPVDATDAQIHVRAQMLVREVYKYAEKYKSNSLVVDGISLLCRRVGVGVPLGRDDAEKIKRAVDKNWWYRVLRVEHARRFEHVAMQLGFVSYKAGVYISDESAQRQIERNKTNAKILANTELQNENGDVYKLAELAALGTANKAIRRGELMTRIKGFEEIASDCGDVGMFWTITCPSKFHAVLSKSGEFNVNYAGASPRDAQAYLCQVWARIRSALKREKIQPYGFRIAEPHHDGCPHWHMLLFVNKTQAARMESIIKDYALREDGNEKGAKENRVKLVSIEAGKGTAAGYIAKYVGKNIDGAHVGDHKTSDGWIVTNDLLGGEEITPSQRVTLWAQLHGIRQFQQIGGAPIGVWRELRRVKAESVYKAPEHIKAAWRSSQREGDTLANFAGYVRAMGGATVGRNTTIKIATREAEIVGRYATYTQDKPCGVYCASNNKAVYESTRYTWTRLEKSGGAAFDLSWTRVNNCTVSPESEEFKKWKWELSQHVEKTKNKNFSSNVDDFIKQWKERTWT